MEKHQEPISQDVPSHSSAFLLRWLRDLLIVTLLLLVLQVLLGLASHSLTLLADSPHSVIDVLTYCFNYWIELLKHREVGAHVLVFGRRIEPWKIDMVGSMISVMVLVVTMSFVVVEVLWEFDNLDQTDDSEFPVFCSSALFVFALVSTISNVVILLMLKRSQAAEERACITTELQEHMPSSLETASNPADACIAPDIAELQIQTVFNGVLRGDETLPPPPPPPNSFPRRERRRKALEQQDTPVATKEIPAESTSFRSVPLPCLLKGPALGGITRSELLDWQKQQGKVSADQSRSADVFVFTEHSKTPPSSKLPNAGSSSKKTLGLSESFRKHTCGQRCNHSGENCKQMNWSAFLHTIVHPGCTGHGISCHHSSGLDELPLDNIAANFQHRRLNLNIDSATLHLVSDVFRGITIFFLAVMIRLEIVSAKKADAICALLVAGLVLIGAGAIFKKAFSVFGCRCLGGGQLYSKFLEVDKDSVKEPTESNTGLPVSVQEP